MPSPTQPIEVPEAPEPDIDLHPMHGPGSHEAWRDGWQKGYQAAAPLLCKQERERLEEALLSEEGVEMLCKVFDQPPPDIHSYLEAALASLEAD